MTEPVPSMTTMAPAVKAALSFWPGLNLPRRTYGSRPTERSHRRSSAFQRLRRPMSWRRRVPHRPATATNSGTGSASPLHTCTWRTSSRRPTAADSGPTYRIDAVPRRIRNRTALTQCNARSAASKRSSRPPSARGLVVATIRLPDPTVDVVAAILPVALSRLAGRDADGVEPLARLVAVHGSDVHPHRTAVGVR